MLRGRLASVACRIYCVVACRMIGWLIGRAALVHPSNSLGIDLLVITCEARGMGTRELTGGRTEEARTTPSRAASSN